MSKRAARRVRRSAGEWRRLIDEQAASGQTQAAFCAARRISVGSFGHWKRRLGAERTPEPWLELTPPAGMEGAGWTIELDLGDGLCLRLRRC